MNDTICTMLYIVSTPIGNIEDISLRARKILEEIPYVITESPQDSGKLFHILGIGKKKMIKYNDRNKARVTDEVIALLREEDAVYVTSAGTPVVSDPGSDLVKRASAEGIEISVIPGPSALTSILAASGLHAQTVIFVGFLPKKKKKIQELLDGHGSDVLFVCFESPYRIVKTLEYIAEILPSSELCVGKEMTKIHEEYIRGSAQDVLLYLTKHPDKVRGEFSIALYVPKKVKTPPEMQYLQRGTKN